MSHGRERAATLLAGDIGGTKTRLGIFREREARVPIAEKTYPSPQYPSLEAMVGEFLKKNQTPIDRASFGVAGPVLGGRAKVTNLEWVVDRASISSSLGITEVTLVNDLVALAKSIPHLEASDCVAINAGRPDPEGPIAVIAPGTGLGEAYVTREGGDCKVHPSEGGHGDFAPRSREEIDLLEDMMQLMDHVSYEEVCSGLGIRNIHTHLARQRPDSPPWHEKEIEAADDPVPVISGSAMGDGSNCRTCAQTLEMFVSILGAEAGNLALRILATGGVYLGGGIPGKILPLLQSGRLLEAFKQKGRMSLLVSRIPLYVITNDDAPLMGAAIAGFERASRASPKEVTAR